MLTLPILPPELSLPLGKFTVDGDVICNYEGVVAVVRPLDVMTSSMWADRFPEEKRAEAATTLVFEQLIRIEGLNMALGGHDPEPFDVANVLHRNSIPMDMRSAIYLALRKRATVGIELEKNSDLPSVSGGIPNGADTPAVDAASETATS